MEATTEAVPTLPASSTFAAEMKQARRASATERTQATTDPVASSEPVAAAPAPVEPGLTIPQDLGTSFDLVDPAAPTPAPAAKAAPKAEAAAPVEAKKAIKIGDRSFDKIEEALEYAKELERSAAADKAYIEGVKDASKKPATEEATAVETPYEKFAKRIFEDPVEAAKEYADNIKQEIVDLYNTSIKQQNQAEAQAVTRESAWENFFKANPDLSDPDTRDIVRNHIMNKHWNELAPLAPEEAWPKLAVYARKALRVSQDAAVPTKEMPSGPVVTTPMSGTEVPVNTEEKPQESLDFVRQLNQFRKGKRK